MSKKYSSENKFFFYLLLSLIIVMSLYMLQGYFILITMAIIFVMLMDPVYRRFVKLFRGNKMIASWSTVITTIILFTIPALFIANLVFIQAEEFSKDVSTLFSSENSNLSLIISDATTRVNEVIVSTPFMNNRAISEQEVEKFITDNINPVLQFLASSVLQLGVTTVNLFPFLVIFMFLVIMIFPSYEDLLRTIKRISPLDDDIDELYIRRFKAMARSMIQGTFVVASAQAILSGITFAIVGVDYSVFWTILTFFTGFFPPFGVAIIVQPMAIFLMLTGHFWEGLFVLLIYTFITANLDNLLRPMLASGEAHLHPALVLLGVIGGLTTFGFFGTIIGPMILILLVTTLDIYTKFYKTGKGSISDKQEKS